MGTVGPGFGDSGGGGFSASPTLGAERKIVHNSTSGSALAFCGRCIASTVSDQIERLLVRYFPNTSPTMHSLDMCCSPESLKHSIGLGCSATACELVASITTSSPETLTFHLLAELRKCRHSISGAGVALRVVRMPCHLAPERRSVNIQFEL